MTDNQEKDFSPYAFLCKQMRDGKSLEEALSAMPLAAWPCSKCALARPWPANHPHREYWWGECSWNALPLTGVHLGVSLPMQKIPTKRIDGPKYGPEKVCAQFQEKAAS